MFAIPEDLDIIARIEFAGGKIVYDIYNATHIIVSKVQKAKLQKDSNLNVVTIKDIEINIFGDNPIFKTKAKYMRKSK
jgi:hypothetical protein